MFVFLNLKIGRSESLNIKFLHCSFFGGQFLPSLFGFPIQTRWPNLIRIQSGSGSEQWGHLTIKTKKAHVPFHTGRKNNRESTGFREYSGMSHFLVKFLPLLRIRIRRVLMFLGFPYSNPDPSIIKQKIVRKHFFLLLCDYFVTFFL